MEDKTAPLSWLSGEAREIFNSCFDWEEETLPAGERRETAGRIGWLLSGTARFCSPVGERRVPEDGIFGVRRNAAGDREAESGTVTAETECTVAWFRYELTRYVCYRACWFHARMLRELESRLPSGGETR
ncbi:MAG: hypothetical protein IJ713_05845 [Oscillibacter sp.]|nr:hypothetical protein [Oscillibacter sp.]